MALYIIRDLSHWAALYDLLFIWTQKYYLTDGGNLVVVCNSTCAIVSVVFNGVKQGGVNVA